MKSFISVVVEWEGGQIMKEAKSEVSMKWKGFLPLYIFSDFVSTNGILSSIILY